MGGTCSASKLTLGVAAPSADSPLRFCAILAVSSISPNVEHACLKPVIEGIICKIFTVACEPNYNTMEAVKAFNNEVCFDPLNQKIENAVLCFSVATLAEKEWGDTLGSYKAAIREQQTAITLKWSVVRALLNEHTVVVLRIRVLTHSIYKYGACKGTFCTDG